MLGTACRTRGCTLGGLTLTSVSFIEYFTIRSGLVSYFGQQCYFHRHSLEGKHIQVCGADKVTATSQRFSGRFMFFGSKLYTGSFVHHYIP